MRNSIRFVYSRGRFEENKFCVVKSCYLSLSLSLVSVLDRYAIAAEHLDSKTLSRNYKLPKKNYFWLVACEKWYLVCVPIRLEYSPYSNFMYASV